MVNNAPIQFTGNDAAVRAFHDFYYYSAVWRNTFWQGTPALKCPLDLWVYQELLVSVRPELVVELGTWAGGSTLFLAHVLDRLGSGKIVTVDLLTTEQVTEHYRAAMPEAAARVRPAHRRIRQIVGSSVDPRVVDTVRTAAERAKSVMVMADSDHSEQHARAELEAYAPMVTPGSYFIMEDTNIPAGGPLQAADAFLAAHAEFQRDRAVEKFFVTFNPGGYLRRV